MQINIDDKPKSSILSKSNSLPLIGNDRNRSVNDSDVVQLRRWFYCYGMILNTKTVRMPVNITRLPCLVAQQFDPSEILKTDLKTKGATGVLSSTLTHDEESVRSSRIGVSCYWSTSRFRSRFKFLVIPESMDSDGMMTSKYTATSG